LSRGVAKKLMFPFTIRQMETLIFLMLKGFFQKIQNRSGQLKIVDFHMITSSPGLAAEIAIY
jgi:hypothetical protein